MRYSLPARHSYSIARASNGRYFRIDRAPIDYRSMLAFGAALSLAIVTVAFVCLA